MDGLSASRRHTRSTRTDESCASSIANALMPSGTSPSGNVSSGPLSVNFTPANLDTTSVKSMRPCVLFAASYFVM